MNIYVGNLAYGVTDAELRALFESHGTVESAEVVFDRRTKRSRGYGFVRMPDADGRAAIAALNGSELRGRTLRIDESKPRASDGDGARRPGRGRGQGGGRHGGDRRPSSDRRPAAAPGDAGANVAAPGVMGFLKRLFGRG